MSAPTAKPPSAGPHQPLERASAVVGVATPAAAIVAAARAVRSFLMGFTSGFTSISELAVLKRELSRNVPQDFTIKRSWAQYREALRHPGRPAGAGGTT